MANKYETVCVFTPDLAGEKLEAVNTKIQKIFTNHKIKEVAKKDWGNRKLAYPIKKNKTGHYVQFTYEGPTEVVSELEKNLGYEESVLRFLTIKENKHTPANVQVEPVGFELPEY